MCIRYISSNKIMSGVSSTSTTFFFLIFRKLPMHWKANNRCYLWTERRKRRNMWFVVFNSLLPVTLYFFITETFKLSSLPLHIVELLFTNTIKVISQIILIKTENFQRGNGIQSDHTNEIQYFSLLKLGGKKNTFTKITRIKIFSV